MQLSLDWTQRERCALMMNQALIEIGIGAAQRAASVLVFAHPAATLIERERQIWLLRISYRAAAQWLNCKSDIYRTLELHHTALHQAVRVWSERGVMHAEGRPTTLLLKATALRDWHSEQAFDAEQFARDWTHKQTHVDKCSIVSSAVDECPRAYQSSERVSDGSFLLDKETQSLTHSDQLPALFAEVWDRQCAEKRLCDALRAWWVAEGLKDRGHKPDAVLGAILAARAKDATSPQSYVERCLSQGVRDGWRQRAAAMLRRTKPQTAGAPVSDPASRSKPARVIGPGLVQEAK